MIPIALSTLLHLEKFTIRGIVCRQTRIACPLLLHRQLPTFTLHFGQLGASSVSLPNPSCHRSDFISKKKLARGGVDILTSLANCAELMELVDKGIRDRFCDSISLCKYTCVCRSGR